MGTYGVNKIQNQAELQQSIKEQQSLEKRRKDDAETRYGNHSAENAAWQEIKQGIPLNGMKGREALTNHMSSTFWVSGFLLNPLFVRAEWKQLSETQETCQRLASRRRAGSALTFTPTRKKQHTEKHHEEI